MSALETSQFSRTLLHALGLGSTRRIAALLLIALSAFAVMAGSASAALDSRGTDFWVTFQPNANPPTLTLFITAQNATTGTVSIPGTAFTSDFSVVPGQTTTVAVPATAAAKSNDGTNQTGIHVVSAGEISLYGLNRAQYTTDAFAALPTDVLGTDFRILSYSGSGPQFAVVASQDATVLTITPKQAMGARPAGVPYTVTLNQGQVYSVQIGSGDVTGTRVVASKPVAVFGGNLCTNIPAGFSACDHITEELPSTSEWGRSFVTAPLASRMKGDTFRILAATDGTTVSVNGAIVATLNAGDFHERIITGGATIDTNHPVLVAQYSNSTSYDGVTSDPFMMLVPPTEQFLNDYTVSTPATGFVKNFVNVVAPNAAIGNLKLDGTVVPAASFTAVGTSGYSTAQLAVAPGTHTLTSSEPFGTFVYGFDEYDSYGYAGGSSFSPVARATSLTIAPLTADKTTGEQHCVVATLRDQFQAAVAGVRVDFTRTGANPGTDSADTAADGTAQHCYTGTAAGTDTIEATVSNLSATATATYSDIPKVTPTLSTAATDGTANGAIRDVATLTGGSAPTGTITFNVYAGTDESCATPLTAAPIATATSADGVYTSENYIPATAGTYKWIATYGGDARNNTVSGTCNEAGETSTVGKATAGLSTAAADGTAGGAIRDVATLTGGAAPTGSVTFNVYAPGDDACATPLNASPIAATEAVSGAGTYTSQDFTTTTAGAYRWIATYSGDDNNVTTSGACGDAGETSTVAKATVGLSTSAGNGTAGGTINDVATLTGGSAAKGTVTFNVYGEGDESCTTPLNAAPIAATTAVSGPGTYTSESFTAPTAGAYRWIATYSGDADNTGIAGACGDAGETSTVGKATPVLSTSASNAALGRAIRDTATVTGPATETGVVTFTVYGPDNDTCEGDGIAVDGGAVSNGTVRSADYTPTAPGAYRWIARYSGDANNEAVTGACNDAGETSTITNPSVAIATTGPATSHTGDPETFTYKVTNPGPVALHDVVVTDNRCSDVSGTVTRTQSGGGADASPATLDNGDTWTFTCAVTTAEGNSQTNTGTVTAKDPDGDSVGPATSQHVTKIVHPAIALDVTGPATAEAGTSVPFALRVTNPGDVALTGSSVQLTDAACASAPTLVSKQEGTAPDASPDRFDPGDVWTYGCSVQTKSGGTQVVNDASVVGRDAFAKAVSANDSATTPLTARPPAGTSDFVSVPSRCVSDTFTVQVRGTSIESVQFAIDGKPRTPITRPDASGAYSLSINPRTRSNARHSVIAYVQYTSKSRTAPKTLTTSFQRCGCVSKRAFDINLRDPRRDALASARITVNGKRIAVRRVARGLRARVRLVGLPQGRVIVRIVARTKGGRTIVGRRVYHPCTERRAPLPKPPV